MAVQLLNLFRFKYGDGDEYKSKVLELLWTIHWWKLGEELLAKIAEKARFTPKLLVENYPEHYGYKDFGPRLYLDLNYCLQQPCSIDPTQEDVIQRKMTFVYLFHELVHYYHDLLGSYKGGTIEEEYRTTGLYEYKNEYFSENAFRRQVHLDRRPCYTWDLARYKHRTRSLEAFY